MPQQKRPDVMSLSAKWNMDTILWSEMQEESSLAGERQRITIARAILKPADVVILDEASAYADPENEVYIEEAINELVKDKTLIVVAHRLETIENSDKIVVVDQGKIVAEGTQSELLKNCALYKRLWNETILTSERKRGECNA